MSYRAPIAFVFMLAAIQLMAKPYIWQEKPSAGNFNINISWPILTGQEAAALMPDRPVPASPYLEFRFEVKTPGDYRIWGRTFDPVWSSPGKWRIDNGPWQKWTPQGTVNREIWSGNFPLDWCLWGNEKLTAGPHTLRLELTGKRKAGDYYYFIMDTLLLTTDSKFQPEGHTTPDQDIEQTMAAIQVESAKITDLSARKGLLEQANELSKVANDDLTAINALKKIARELHSRSESKIIDDGSAVLLHCRVEKVTCSNGKVSWQLLFNRPWAGKYWVGFSQDNALYAARLIENENSSRIVSSEIAIPAGLPSGRINLRFVPLNTPSAITAQANIYINSKDKPVKPGSWGVYRDSAMVQHPWYVNENNLLIWDGSPYIPFGGMMNSRVTWTTRSGDTDGDGHLENGLALVENHFKLLQKYGISDVYFNACFLHSNPNYIRKLVALTEKYDMQYGLEVTSVPDTYSKGFVKCSENTIAVKAGAMSAEIQTTTSYPIKPLPQYNEHLRFNPPHRCAWILTDVKGKLLDAGIGQLKQNGTQDGIPSLTMKATFKRSAPAGSKLDFMPEITIHGGDPVGYLDSIDEYIAKVKDVYGSLKLGKNLRFFIDPLQNEMNATPTAIPTGEKFRDGFCNFLFARYQNIAILNRAWQTEGNSVPDFKTASRLLPVHSGTDTSRWIDPETSKVYIFTNPSSQALFDLREYRGQVCQRIINRVSDTLKSIADVPVILKHNIWFSDWFVNPQKNGGMDGVGMESYCYGDSLAYHNSVVVYAEALQSARNQWCLVTESSAAAFEGQKDYCGYMDRLQMMYDIDQLSMLGAKGFFHFGFSFDPDGGRFFTTELPRDPRQLEWLATQAKIYRQSAVLPDYRPEVYGWFPACFREQDIVGNKPFDYEMDGNYMGNPTQIRMAPDGNWIVPAVNVQSDWKGLFVAEPLLSNYALKVFNAEKPLSPLFRLTRSGSDKLDAFTCNGIGLISAGKNVDRLQQFQEKVLGYIPFRTEDVNGCGRPDGTVLVWTCVERKQATLQLPPNAEAFTLDGKKIAIKGNAIILTRGEYKQLTKDLPSHLPNGYYYLDNGQPEAAVIRNTSPAEIRKLNRPAYFRWLPKYINRTTPMVWIEAEDFITTTFTQPSLVGYTRYSDRAIGINTHYPAPEGKSYESTYRFATQREMNKAVFHLRRMDAPAMDIEIVIDGKSIGIISADANITDKIHLTPWNAGLSKDNIFVGWTELKIGHLSAGNHKLTVRATGNSRQFAADTKLMGGDAEKRIGAGDIGNRLRAVQIDAYLISE